MEYFCMLSMAAYTYASTSGGRSPWGCGGGAMAEPQDALAHNTAGPVSAPAQATTRSNGSSSERALMITAGQLSQITLQRACPAHVPEPRQRFFLDLPHALARDAEQRPDLLERHRLAAVQAEVEAKNLGLALLEGRKRLLDRLPERLLERLVGGRRVHRVRQVIEELVVLAGRERRIEGEVRLRDRHRLRDLFLGDVHAVRDLFVRRIAAELLEQRIGALADAMERAGAIQRDPNDARLFGQRLQNRLADPPHRVRDELDALRLVEFVSGANEAQVAFIDQVRERHALVLILFRHRHDEPQIRPHEFVEALLVAHTNLLGQPPCFVAG